MGTKQVAAVGGLVLIVGCFLPFVYLPILGGFNCLVGNNGYGWALLIVAVFGCVCALRQRLRAAAICGGAVLTIVLLALSYLIWTIIALKTARQNHPSDGPFGAMADGLALFLNHTLGNTMQVGPGGPVMVIGAVAMITGFFMESEPIAHPSAGEAHVDSGVREPAIEAASGCGASKHRKLGLRMVLEVASLVALTVMGAFALEDFKAWTNLKQAEPVAASLSNTADDPGSRPSETCQLDKEKATRPSNEEEAVGQLRELFLSRVKQDGDTAWTHYQLPDPDGDAPLETTIGDESYKVGEAILEVKLSSDPEIRESADADYVSETQRLNGVEWVGHVHLCGSVRYWAFCHYKMPAFSDRLFRSAVPERRDLGSNWSEWLDFRLVVRATKRNGSWELEKTSQFYGKSFWPANLPFEACCTRPTDEDLQRVGIGPSTGEPTGIFKQPISTPTPSRAVEISSVQPISNSTPPGVLDHSLAGTAPNPTLTLNPTPTATPWNSYLPNRLLTPGSVVTYFADDISSPKYSGEAPQIAEEVRRTVFASYGLAPDDANYELDRLVPFSLGGSDAPNNLWPMPRADVDWPASKKAALAAYLRERVLRARHVISVAERQLVIAVRSIVYERLVIHLLRDGPLATPSVWDRPSE